jgi:hypothetical protein
MFAVVISTHDAGNFGQVLKQAATRSAVRSTLSMRSSPTKLANVSDQHGKKPVRPTSIRRHRRCCSRGADCKAASSRDCRGNSMAQCCSRALLLADILRPSETTFAALVGILAGNIVNVCLIVKVSRGRNWARLVFLVAALIDVAARIFQLFGPALVQTGELVQSAFEIPLMITAIYLLFTEPARRWFRR